MVEFGAKSLKFLFLPLAGDLLTLPATIIAMPFFRNFTYWIDKRRWKYVFLLKTLELSL
jgi:hypothetical protein